MVLDGQPNAMPEGDQERWLASLSNFAAAYSGPCESVAVLFALLYNSPNIPAHSFRKTLMHLLADFASLVRPATYKPFRVKTIPFVSQAASAAGACIVWF